MAENTVKKIATRESYGNALLELGELLINRIGGADLRNRTVNL
mgnify:CR=1 FL=1